MKDTSFYCPVIFLTLEANSAILADSCGIHLHMSEQHSYIITS